MDLALLLGKQVCSILIYMLLGFISYKKKLVTIEQSKGMSSALLYIFTPCLIFQSFQMDFQSEKLQGLLYGLFASLVATLFFIFVAKYIFLRKETPLSPVERGSVAYTNVGNLSVPLIGATLGMEAIFYATGFVIMSTVFLWTVCLYQISGEKSQISVKRFLFNPSVIAVVLGLIAFFFSLRLPTVISTATIGLGNCVGPLALFLIGLYLGTVKFKELFTNVRLYYVVALRLAIAPMLLILFFKVTHFTSIIPNGKEVLTVILIASFAPISTTLSIFALQFNKNADYASKLNIISTCLCVITMPIMLAISQIIL